MGPRLRGDDATIVVSGLDPAIHLLGKLLFGKLMDARIKSGHDDF
jgi:hypothetical protein